MKRWFENYPKALTEEIIEDRVEEWYSISLQRNEELGGFEVEDLLRWTSEEYDDWLFNRVIPKS